MRCVWVLIRPQWAEEWPAEVAHGIKYLWLDVKIITIYEFHSGIDALKEYQLDETTGRVCNFKSAPPLFQKQENYENQRRKSRWRWQYHNQFFHYEVPCLNCADPLFLIRKLKVIMSIMPILWGSTWNNQSENTFYWVQKNSSLTHDRSGFYYS